MKPNPIGAWQAEPRLAEALHARRRPPRRRLATMTFQGRRSWILGVILLMTACGGQPSAGPVATINPTAAASATAAGSGGSSGQPTPAQTEGPSFKPGSPMRTSLVEPVVPG